MPAITECNFCFTQTLLCCCCCEDQLKQSGMTDRVQALLSICGNENKDLVDPITHPTEQNIENWPLCLSLEIFYGNGAGGP